MRPRPDAAENAGIGEFPAGAAGGASMRPRPDAAENIPVSNVSITHDSLQ